MKPRAFTALLLVPVVFQLLTGTAEGGQKTKTLLDLRGKWKFELGDDPRWAEPTFLDKDWASISVPAKWETQGFPGYDGYGWYRRSFDAPADWANKRLYLNLGRIDDVDEVYVNGRFIGFNGSFPPNYETAYGNTRHYPIPPGTIIPGGRNVIAVRVYDSEMEGGIVQGPLQIQEDVYPLVQEQSLEGKWRFTTGDDMSWAEPGFNDKRWEVVEVPSFWETQGHKHYDGYGWYRLRFRPSDLLKDQHLVLFMGKIDDFDEVYLNGVRIGKTGRFDDLSEPSGSNVLYRDWRAYTIPAGLLKFRADNVIAVRVYDGFMHGGIYEGPVGLVRREVYMKWESSYGNDEKNKSPWRFFEWFFD